MKVLLSVFLMSLLLMTSSACAAAQEEDKNFVFVHSGEKYGLGVAIADLEPEDRKRLGIEKGARILEVIEDTEAERIGLKEDDVIVEFDGKKVTSAEELHDMVAGMDKEKDVKLTIFRDKKEQTMTATVQKIEPRKVTVQVNGDDFQFGDFSGLDKIDVRIPKIWQGHSKGGFLGISAEDLSEQMLDYFKVEHGVLVEEVHENTPAEKAGLKAGDVITSIEGRKIKDYDDLIRTLNYYNPEETVKIEFVRKGKSRSVNATLIKKDPQKHVLMLPGMDGPRHARLMKWFDEDSLKGFKKEMKVLKKNLQNMKEELKDIDINLKLFII